MNLVMIQSKYVLNTKQERWLTIELKMLKLCKIVFSIMQIVIFDGAFFNHEFYIFGHAHILFSIIAVCIHLKCYTTNDVHLIICTLCEEIIETMNGPKKKMYYSPKFSSFCFFKILVKKYFDMCFDNLIKFYASHHYYIQLVLYDINQFIHLQTCFT